MFNFLKKESTPEEQLSGALSRAHKKREKERLSLEQRQKKIRECYAVLDECYNTFEKIIYTERSRFMELDSQGFDASSHRARIREAAIGMLVTKEAKAQMSDLSTDEEITSAMNRMGMALKQVNRLSSTGKGISKSTESILKQWYPYPLQEDPAHASAYGKLNVPQEIRDRIDERFLSDLMDGAGFESCLMHSMSRTGKKSNKQTRMDDDMDFISKTLDADDADDIRKTLEDKFGNIF